MAESLTDLMERLRRYIGAEMHVMLPARVVRYDHTQQRADVQPAVRRAYRDNQASPPAIITDVPVIWPRSGGASMTFPINPGDTVALVFGDVDMDGWVQAGGVRTPVDPRQHSLNDAVAIPGLIPFSTGGLAENNSDVLIRYSGGRIRIKPSGAVELQGPQVSSITPLHNVTGDVDVGGNTSTAGDTSTGGDLSVGGNAQIDGNLAVCGGLTGCNGSPGRFLGDLIVTGDIYDKDGSRESLDALREAYNNHTHTVTTGAGSFETSEPDMQVG